MKIVSKTLKKNHNVSTESDSSLFIRYVWFFFFIAVSIYLFFFLLSFIVIHFVSVEDERKWFPNPDLWFETLTGMTEELNTMYPDSPYTLSVIEMDDEENAFAWPGGHMYFTRALLENTQYKNELDFVVGHEMYHTLNRDVIKGAITKVPLYIFLSFLGNSSGQLLFDWFVANPHSKAVEIAADKAWVDFVAEKNGHIWCVLDFLKKNNTIKNNAMTLFSSHPMSATRILLLESYITKQWYLGWECEDLEFNTL